MDENTTQDLPPGLVELLLGIMADGKVVESEVAMLESWLAARPEAEGYAVRTLRQRLEQVRKKGFDCREGKALYQLMASLIAGFLPDWASRTMLPAPAPPARGRQEPRGQLFLTPEVPGMYDHGVDIDLGAAFCLTGIFAFGEREDVEREINAHWGEVIGHPVKKRPCFVVVGSVASPDWAHGNYGRKIERAMELREAGAPCAIISEDMWAAAVTAVQGVWCPPAPPHSSCACSGQPWLWLGQHRRYMCMTGTP